LNECRNKLFSSHHALRGGEWVAAHHFRKISIAVGWPQTKACHPKDIGITFRRHELIFGLLSTTLSVDQMQQIANWLDELGLAQYA